MEFSPKKSVLTNAFKKLKSNISLVQYSSDEDDQPTKKGTATAKNGGTSTSAKSAPSGDKTLTRSYLMWENRANVCWLDASMALLVHNKTLTESLAEDSSTQIVNIIRYYYEAVSILNDYSDERHIDVRILAAKELLKTVQESTLKYLHPILKYKEGEPDSAFCSLFNLITEDKSVKDFFDLEFTWMQVCKKCDSHRVRKHRKPIVTLPRVAAFNASSPIAIYQCPVCKEPDQNMMLYFRTLPQCIIFHFESGAGKGELQCKDFEVDGRNYRMTGVMTLEKGKESLVNHFITFIRDPASDTWLECNDLNDEIMCFCMLPPFLVLEDVYIIMYEAADRLGTVPNSSLALDKCGLGEESVSGNADIPLIDLADDTEKDLPNEKGNKGCNEPKVGSKRSKNVSSLDVCEDGTNVDPISETIKCVNNVICEGKTQLGSDEVTATQALQEIPLVNQTSPSDINEIGVTPEKDRSQESLPSDIISKDVVSCEEIKHSTEDSQATVQNESILVIDASTKNANVSSHTSIPTKNKGPRGKNSSDAANKISANSTFDKRISRTNKNVPNTSQTLISKSEIILKNDNINDQSTEKDLKVADKNEIFLLNLDLCQKTKLKESLQNKYNSPIDQVKNIHSESKNNILEINNQPQTNTSPTKIEASSKLNDISNKTAPESPKSDGQMVAKTYKKLMHTLETAVLRQEVPLALCIESDKSKVPNTELTNEFAAKDLKNEINKTKPLLMQVCEDFNSEVLHADSDLNIGGVKNAAKTSHSEPTTEITAKFSRRKLRKTQPKVGQQGHKVTNSQTVQNGSDKESKSDQVNILAKPSTDLTVTSTKRRVLPKRDSKSSAEVAVRVLMGKMNKTKSKLETNQSSSDIVHNNSKEESYKGKVDIKTQELATLDVNTQELISLDVKTQELTTSASSNAKRQWQKSGTISPVEEEGNSEQAVQPKRKCRRRSVCLPDSIPADTESPVSIDTKNIVSLDTDKHVPEKVKRKRGKCNSNLPEVLGKMMEQTAVVNHPKETHCKINSESVSPKSPLQQENETNLEMTDQKPECNLADQKRLKHSSNDCTESRKCRRRSVCLPDSIPADTESPVLIDTKNIVSLDTDKHVPEKVKRKRGKCNYNLTEVLGKIMEETADVNHPKETHCKINSESVSLKSPLQQENETNLEMTDQKPECNLADQKRLKHSSNYCTESKMSGSLPLNCNESSQIDSEMMECREGCDCDSLGMDETIDIVADSVLHSIFGFFGIRKH